MQCFIIAHLIVLVCWSHAIHRRCICILVTYAVFTADAVSRFSLRTPHCCSNLHLFTFWGSCLLRYLISIILMIIRAFSLSDGIHSHINGHLLSLVLWKWPYLVKLSVSMISIYFSTFGCLIRLFRTSRGLRSFSPIIHS